VQGIAAKAGLVPAFFFWRVVVLGANKKPAMAEAVAGLKSWWALKDSNLRPTD